MGRYMKQLLITHLSVSDMKKLFREEMEDFFQNKYPLEKREEDQLGRIELAEEITKLSKATIYSLTSKRKIPYSKIGKYLYFSRKDLLTWIASGKRRTESEIRVEAANFKSKYKY